MKTNENVSEEFGSINREQEKVIKTLEDVLSFLKSVQIKNEESLVHMKKPLDDLQSALKYIPTESFFSNLPTEITTDILSYLCDSGAFLAAYVCKEWEEILRGRLENTTVRLGKHCSNDFICENYKCFIPTEMLKVSAARKLDVNLPLALHICHDVQELNSELVTDGLTSVPNLTIDGDCGCDYNLESVLSNNQLEHLFDGIEKSSNVMNKLELKNIDLTYIDQDKLINCLLTKTKKLDLDKKYGKMLNVEMLIAKLLQDLPEDKLSDITLNNFQHSDELGEDLADALCKVENVSLGREFPRKRVTIKKLFRNILSTRPIKTTALIIDIPIAFDKTCSPEDLRKLVEKFELLRLYGRFTLEQLEVARLIAKVKQGGITRNGTPNY